MLIDEGSVESGYGFTVDRDNILRMQAPLLHEGYDLRGFLRQEQANLRLPPLGKDPVSVQGTPAFQAKISENSDSVYERSLEYAQKLIDAANALSETAKIYGYTEDEIKANLDRINNG